MKTIDLSNNILLSTDKVAEMIQKAVPLVLSGSEKALSKMPKGQWIGGTIPYFMSQDGGCFDEEKIFVTNLSSVAKSFKIKEYTPQNLNEITADRFDNGFSYILLPGFSEIHSKYALLAPELPEIFDAPLIGWITGFDLNNSEGVTPKVINGTTGKFLDNSIVIVHVELPENKHAKLEILNIFSQGDGDTITFDNNSFSAKECKVNGQTRNFAEYIAENEVNISHPLVADYCGAKINVSIREINQENKEVAFYAPVHTDTEYKFAKKIDNYVETFLNKLPDGSEKIEISCNCILNYLYSELEGKKTANVTGPFTFGEIAYILLNQTMVYLEIV